MSVTTSPIDHIADLVDPLLNMENNFLLKFLDISFEKMILLINLMSDQNLSIEMKHVNFSSFFLLNMYLFFKALDV